MHREQRLQHRPLLSIVIANYNYGRFLEEAIQSVLSQTCQDYELIIVDGGSTDNSADVIKKYASRMVWWCSEPDGGQSAAFNKGFAHAKGRFLTWLNADDVMFPGAIEALARTVRECPTAKWVVGSTVWCDQYMNIVRVFCAHKFSVLRSWARMVTAAGPSSFFDRELYIAAGGVDENLHFVMDTDLWSRFIFHQHCKYVCMREYIWGYRIHEESKMSGPTVDPDSNKSRARRARLFEERAILCSRYGSGGLLRKVLQRIPASFIDLAVAVWRQYRYVGRSINSISKTSFIKPRVLLSNSIIEYVTGTSAVADEVFVFNTWRRGRLENNGNVTVLELKDFPYPKTLAKYVDGNGINVLYAQGAQSLLQFARVKRKCQRLRPKVLATAHSGYMWQKKFKAFLFVALAGIKADGLVFISQSEMKRWQWLCRLIRLKCWHVPNPVDIARFSCKDRIQMRAGDSVCIGSVGVVRPAKGQLILIQVVKELVRRGRNVTCRIAGDVGDVEYGKMLMEYVHANGMDDIVCFDGQIPYWDIPTWLHQLDIYCCSSECEVMPFSILEAMASGLPVVAHDVGAIGEQVLDDENGFLVRSENVAEYADAVEKILADYERFSRASRRRAEDVFAMNHYADAMRKIF